MIQMFTPVYTTDHMKYKVADVKKAVRLTRQMSRVYLIVLNLRSGGQVEMFGLCELNKQFPPARDYVIAGVAESPDKARELLAQIAEEAFCRTGSADLAAYLADAAGRELITLRE